MGRLLHIRTLFSPRSIYGVANHSVLPVFPVYKAAFKSTFSDARKLSYAPGKKGLLVLTVYFQWFCQCSFVSEIANKSYRKL